MDGRTAVEISVGIIVKGKVIRSGKLELEEYREFI